MTPSPSSSLTRLLADTPTDLPVLIAGPTASGKSALALALAETQGGVIVNADASQVYKCWRVITARPSAEEEARVPHLLYGHVAASQTYSAGHWLREVAPLLKSGPRPIIVGGTGLNFAALNDGLAEIPATPAEIRKTADEIPLPDLLAQLDPQTAGRIDTANRARVQRAWEVLHATGQGLARWQDETPPPLLPATACTRFVLNADKDWLNMRIETRFDAMMAGGALEEIAAVAPEYDPGLPAHRAIGVPELMAAHREEISLADARAQAIVATRQYAKRQRTWFRKRMRDWTPIHPQDLP